VCSFTTDDESDAMAHFEDFDHDLALVDETVPSVCSICGGETEHDADAHAEEGRW
jgi:hypothetical protein